MSLTDTLKKLLWKDSCASRLPIRLQWSLPPGIHTLVGPSHTVPGIVCMTKRTQEKWWRVTPEIKSYKAVQLSHGCSFILPSLRQQEASCHVTSNTTEMSLWWELRLPAHSQVSDTGSRPLSLSSLWMSAAWWKTLSQNCPARQLLNSWPTDTKI